MDSAAEIRRIGERARRGTITRVTPGDDYNENHSEAKVRKQVRWIKDNLGLGTVFVFVTAVCTTLLLIVNLATPAVKQGEINGTTTRALDALTKAQQDNKEEQSRALAAATAQQSKELAGAVNEIKAMVKQSLDLAQQNQAEMRSMRESSERQLIEVRQDTKALWNWLGELKNKITTVEAEVKLRPKGN